MHEVERRLRMMINPFSTAFTRWWCHSAAAWARRRRSRQAKLWARITVKGRACGASPMSLRATH